MTSLLLVLSTMCWQHLFLVSICGVEIALRCTGIWHSPCIILSPFSPIPSFLNWKNHCWWIDWVASQWKLKLKAPRIFRFVCTVVLANFPFSSYWAQKMFWSVIAILIRKPIISSSKRQGGLYTQTVHSVNKWWNRCVYIYIYVRRSCAELGIWGFRFCSVVQKVSSMSVWLEK